MKVLKTHHVGDAEVKVIENWSGQPGAFVTFLVCRDSFLPLRDWDGKGRVSGPELTLEQAEAVAVALADYKRKQEEPQ